MKTYTPNTRYASFRKAYGTQLYSATAVWSSLFHYLNIHWDYGKQFFFHNFLHFEALVKFQTRLYLSVPIEDPIEGTIEPEYYEKKMAGVEIRISAFGVKIIFQFTPFTIETKK